MNKHPLALSLLLIPLILSACQPHSPTVEISILPTAEPTRTATIALTQTSEPSPTPSIVPTKENVLYTSERYGVSFEVPEGLEQVGEDHFEGETGFVRIEPYESTANYVSRACDWEANLHPEKYGLRPQLDLESSHPEFVVTSCTLVPAPDATDKTVQIFFRTYRMTEEPTMAVLTVDAEFAELVQQSFQIVWVPVEEQIDPEPSLRFSRDDIELTGPQTQVVNGFTFRKWQGPQEKLAELRQTLPTGAQPLDDAVLLVEFNESLAHLGYRLVEVSDEAEPAYDLYQGEQLVEDFLAPPFWPITTSQNDFAMVTGDLNGDSPGRILFRASAPANKTNYDLDLHFWMPPVFVGDKLATVEREIDGSTTRAVVKLEGEPVYTYSSSMYDYERTMVRSFASWDGHWVMNANNTLIIDGENINTKLGYGEVFNWQTFEGQPWFFFEKDGRYGISYGGEELPLTWEHIPHLDCCGGWHNPTGLWMWGGRDTITFYAWEDGAYSFYEVRKE